VTDLVEFLRARLDNDASWALACTHRTGEMPQPFRADHRKVFGGNDVVAETRSATLAQHIALHDPARVLHEVEAKRRILARHAECGTGSGYCDDGGHDLGSLGCSDLLDLAAPFAGEPGYKEDWAV
jgi:hypothetical protein